MMAIGLERAGDVSAAAEAYRESISDLRAGGNVFAVGRAIAHLAAIEMTRGDPAAALSLCEDELEGRAPEPRATSSPALWVAMAATRADVGQVKLAQETARQALELARRLGDTPNARAAEAILARLEETVDGGRDNDRSRRGTVLVDALTAREVEVLRLVARGRSNSQIATELFVTVGTVKAHLHTISGKLGAANRVEAVARGRELGLLD
jgi:DNA-binding CsgD family transcriptional regulator